jgi:hypothetical protein
MNHLIRSYVYKPHRDDIHMHDTGSHDQLVNIMADEDVVNIANITPYTASKLVEYVAAAQSIINLACSLDYTADKPFACHPETLTPMTRTDCPDRVAISVALTFVTTPPAIEPATFSSLLTPYLLDPVVANYAALLASRATA